MEMTTEREQELAQNIFDAIKHLLVGHTQQEIINSLFAVLLERIEHDDDPADRAEAIIQALRANLIGTAGGPDRTRWTIPRPCLEPLAIRRCPTI